MNRRIIPLFISLIVIVRFCPVSSATDARTVAQGLYQALDENGQEAALSAEEGTGFDLNLGLKKIIEITLQNFAPILYSSAGNAAKLLLVAILFSLVGLVCGKGNVMQKCIILAATGSIAVIGITEINSGLHVAIEHQNRLSDFIRLLLPVLTAAGAAGGNGGESLMLQSGIALFCQITVDAYTKIFIPFVYFYIALRLCGAISDNQFFRKFADWIKGIITGAIRIWLMLFFAYLTISGIAGKAADSLALRSAKTAASSVPYIGGIAAEATDAIAAGASVIKAYLGVFGTIGVLGSAIVPLLSCGLGWGCIKLACLFSSVMPNSVGTEAIELISEAFGFIFSLCAASTALILMSVIVSAKTIGIA